MRPYINLSESEQNRFNIDVCWNPDKIEQLILPTPLIWVHTLHRKNSKDTNTIKTIILLNIKNNRLTTDFGTYALENGKNIRSFSGIHSTDDCHGRLYLFKKSH